MRVLARVLVGGGMVAAAVPSVLVASATAETARTSKPAVLQSNWFWHQASTDQLAGTPAQGAVPEPSGVPAGDLALAVTDPSTGSPSKEPYLAFDLGGATSGARVSDFTFTLPLDPAATQANAGTVPLKACLPTRLWTNNPDGGTDWNQKPADDCGTSVRGSYDATKQAYTFTVPAYAMAWLGDVNTGVAILPDGYTNPFQLAFSAAKTVTAKMTYAPAAPVAPPSTTTQPVAPAAAPVAVFLPAPASLPAAPVSLPDGGTAPVTAPTTPTTQAPLVAGALPTGHLVPTPVVKAVSAAPTAGFWLAGGVLALLLVAISLVLGDAEWAFTTGVRTSRLDQLLRARRGSRRPVTLSLMHTPEPERAFS